MIAIPTFGPFHILHPRYNGVTVMELVRAANPSHIYLASYSAADFEQKLWREANEVPFFHVLPWAQRANRSVVALDEQSQLKTEAERFNQALGMYPKGQAILQQAADLEAQLQHFLSTPKTPADFSNQAALQPLSNYLEGYAALFGEGPATGFRRQRLEAVALKVERLSKTEDSVILVDLLDYPMLMKLLPPATSHPLPAHSPTEAEQQRSVLDRAWQLNEADDWAKLLAQLQEVDGPEAMYCAAQVYLAAGQPADALELLEQLVHTDFVEPEYLPGYTLARYGQLADLQNQRDKALRAYAAVLALEWVPQEAKEIALAGQRTAFKI